MTQCDTYICYYVYVKISFKRSHIFLAYRSKSLWTFLIFSKESEAYMAKSKYEKNVLPRLAYVEKWCGEDCRLLFFENKFKKFAIFYLHSVHAMIL